VVARPDSDAITFNFPVLSFPSGQVLDHRHPVFFGQGHGNLGAFFSACDECLAVSISNMPLELSASNDRRRAEADLNRGDFGFDQNCGTIMGNNQKRV
jgi:hypothetical protein